MDKVLIGLAGMLLGILLTEYFRRKSRIETYSKETFHKRLKVYEKLYDIVNEVGVLANDIIDNAEYSKEERKEIWSVAVLKLAEYLDKNSFYVDEDIAVHCMTAMIGVEDIHYEDDKKRQDRVRAFRDDFPKTKSMIKKESGLKEIEKLFKSISKPKHRSDYISYYRNLKKRYRDKPSLDKE